MGEVRACAVTIATRSSLPASSGSWQHHICVSLPTDLYKATREISFDTLLASRGVSNAIISRREGLTFQSCCNVVLLCERENFTPEVTFVNLRRVRKNLRKASIGFVITVSPARSTVCVSVCLSVCPHGTFWVPLDGFSSLRSETENYVYWTVHHLRS